MSNETYSTIKGTIVIEHKHLTPEQQADLDEVLDCDLDFCPISTVDGKTSTYLLNTLTWLSREEYLLRVNKVLANLGVTVKVSQLTWTPPVAPQVIGAENGTLV